MPITIKNTAGGGVTLDSTTSSNETLQLPSGGGTLAPLASPSFTGTTSANKLNVTGVVDNTISGTLVVKGSLSANQTSGLALFQQSSTASTIKAFGPNATTTGILNTYVAASDGSPDLLITSVTANGLTFNGDTAAANALDDYEEGTWTPVDGSGAGLTISVNNANYTKIGRIVHINAYVGVPSTSSTAQFVLSGLPFAVSGSASYFPTILNHNSSAPVGSIMRADSSSNNVVAFTQANASVTNQNLSNGIVIFQLTYRTDS